MIPFYEDFFQASDGTRLYRRWWGEARKGTIVLVHGFGDHVGRYRYLVQALCKHGYRIEGFDSRGHGQSGGVRGHVDPFSQYTNDLHTFLQLIQRQPTGPLFLLGHSQGGHIVLRYGLEQPKAPIQGIVVSSPFLGMSVKLPAWQSIALKALDRLYEQFSQAVPIQESDLSHDQGWIEETKRDPLYGRTATARWYTSTRKAHQLIHQKAEQFRHPLLLQQAGEDRLIDASAGLRFFEKIRSIDKQRIEYPGYYHEIYNETPDRRGSVFADLTTWLNEHLPSEE